MSAPKDNPLLDLSFELPFDRIEAAHIEPGIDALIEATQAKLDALSRSEGPRTYANTLEALEGATLSLSRAMGVIGHLESVAHTPALREAHNAVRPKVSALYSKIPLDSGIYRALREFAETEEARSLDRIRARLLEKSLDDFRRHGAELPPEGKARLEAIDIELSELTTRFAQSVLDTTHAFELLFSDAERLRGLPESALAAAREDARSKDKEGYRLTLQAPSLVPALTYLEDASIREEMYRAYNNRASEGEHDNGPRIARILELRREKANLLGYANFADFVLEDRMAKSGETARLFLADLEERTRPFFERENEALAAFRRELEGPDAPPLMPWDVAFYAEKLRERRYDFDEEALRPYFPVDRAMQGLFSVVERLYGVRVEPWEAPTWHPEVQTYRLVDADGAWLASFYVDLYPRESKRGGAWMNSFITGLPQEDGSYSPHLGLFCANVTKPLGDRPALLTHREVETLFHEFGHLMHHCLTRVPVRSLAGTRVAWDFVELPSQIMENWTWEREALDLLARHYQSGEPIPEPLFTRMRAARTFRAANAMMRQLSFGTTDLWLHTAYDPETDGSPVELAKAQMQRFSPAPLPEPYAMICGFTHLFSSPVGYAAGYYSYKWAEVLDADAFTRFAEEGIFNPEVGRDFREHILAKGDSEDAAELFVAFMGREPDPEALLRRSGLSVAPDSP